MITRKQYRSAQETVHYFDSSLAQSDYHSRSGQVIGTWNGKGKDRLGLSNEVSRTEFEQLINNINPATGKRLTSRTVKNRTVAEDWTMSTPKSVSIQYAITEDEDILSAVQKAVQTTMQQVEQDAQTRVRIKGRYADRRSGNIVYASFLHDDTRPVEHLIDGRKVFFPDPQLHVHNIIMNGTYDEQEERWKAVQFRNMVASIPYYRELFGSSLAQELQQVGYQLERTKQNFEIVGYTRATISKFSNRQRVIEEIATKKGITDPAAKAALGAKTRSGKRKGYSKEELQQFRLAQLDETELQIIHNAKGVVDAGEKRKDDYSAQEAVEYAIQHGLARKSVVDHNELLKHALNYGKVSTTKKQLEFAIAAHKYLRSKDTDQGRIYTNVEAHVEEKKLIAEARTGTEKYRPLNPDYKIQNPQLTDEQREAVHHVLQSKDFITIIKGRAGVGKTWSIKEVAAGAKQNGTRFGAFAPSAEASRRVQREDGFERATTIAELLVNQQRQEQIKGGVIWVDEAGMVGNGTMNRVVNLAKKQNARILLTGDPRQHSSVERGDSMRILEQYGNVPTISISKNQRQKNDDYRQAINQISEGQMEEGYQSLDKMKAIKEAENMDDLRQKVANEYVQSVKSRDKAIVVAVTHAQGEAVTDSIRDKLKAEELLDKEERKFSSFKNKALDNAQKRDRIHYEPGNVVEYHQNAKGGIVRGDRFEVASQNEGGQVMIRPEGKTQVPTPLPFEHSAKFSVYEKRELAIAVGEQIRISKSGYTPSKHRLENGDVMSVKEFTKEGHIRAHTGRKTITIDKNFGHLSHGYTMTSQKVQGKTVNKVIIMQGSVSGQASSMEQFYVSASRGRFAVSVHTDDKELLLHNIKRSSQRMEAMQVAGEKEKGGKLKETFERQRVAPSPPSASQLNTRWQQKQTTPPEEEDTSTIDPPPPPSPQFEPDSLTL